MRNPFIRLIFLVFILLSVVAFPIIRKASDASVHIYSRIEVQGITISQNGNVGICTVSPTEALSVSGNGLFSGTITANRFVGNGSGLTNLPIATANLALTSNIAISLNAQGLIGAISVATGNTIMAITISGNVGIGTTAPTTKLEVAGTVSASAVVVNGLASAANFLPIPTANWPDFDAGSPYLIYGALWVGWDATAQVWKYHKQNGATAPRGLTDPGNPNTWTVNGSTMGYFNGNLSSLPSGTHINNKYNPDMMAYRCNQDDIQIKIGSVWVDKYANRILDVGSSYSGSTLKDDGADMQGSGQTTSPYWMAFSQKAQCSTGMTWFIAQIAANNAGKRLPANEEWQSAAMGTARSAGNGVANGDSWSSVTDTDLSRYGVVGMVGNIWEWVGTWWQSGIKTTTFTQGESAAAWGASYGDDYTWNVNGSAYGNAGWTNNLPAALLRGGLWGSGTNVGVFALFAYDAPSSCSIIIGFRSVR